VQAVEYINYFVNFPSHSTASNIPLSTVKKRQSVVQEDLNRFVQICGEGFVFSEVEVRSDYAHDETEDLKYPPEVVVKPRNAEEVSAVLAYCNARGIPVTPIGARTGLSGGALCVHGGVGLSLERFNRIIKIDEDNQQVFVEPGVITQVLQEAVAAKGLFYGPDPASRGSCFIGGNIAENSGGPRALKYGVTKDWVLNLQVVLASGDIIWTGANTLKNSTGYNLTQLMVGSEGTLGVVTQAVLKLLPLPRLNKLLLAPFKSEFKACEAVAAIFKAGIMPSALEFMERDAIVLSLKYVGESSISLGSEDRAHLLIEVDGNDEDFLLRQCEQLAEVLEQYDVGAVMFADDEAQKDQLWKLRRKVGEAVKMESIYKEEDTVVPRYHLAELLTTVKAVSKEFGFKSICYGHAGDGNLHVNILKGELSDDIWNRDLEKAIKLIFTKTIALGGTLSGEHGIGLVQRPYMSLAFSEIELNLMRGIKAHFDPHGILNPGKIFP
jgi:glycolate oxidase